MSGPLFPLPKHAAYCQVLKMGVSATIGKCWQLSACFGKGRQYPATKSNTGVFRQLAVLCRMKTLSGVTPRPCSQDGEKMRRLSIETASAILTHGKRKDEAVQKSPAPSTKNVGITAGIKLFEKYFIHLFQKLNTKGRLSLSLSLYGELCPPAPT